MIFVKGYWNHIVPLRPAGRIVQILANQPTGKHNLQIPDIDVTVVVQVAGHRHSLNRELTAVNHQRAFNRDQSYLNLAQLDDHIGLPLTLRSLVLVDPLVIHLPLISQQ